MDGPRNHPPSFFHPPPSVSALVAALLEPAIAAGSYLGLARWQGDVLDRPDTVLCLLVFALAFPGRDRLADAPCRAAADIARSWLLLLALLLACGWASNSLQLFAWPTLLAWAAGTPLLLWGVVLAGQAWLRWHAALPGRRPTAVVVGAGALGVRVAQALRRHGPSAPEVLGYFDDRRDARRDPGALDRHLGDLAELPAFVQRHGVREVYLTLPLGGQPRTARLLRQLQGTTASVFFVPDVLDAGIVRGRLLHVNGLPAVGLCDTPFRGSDRVLKRASDIVLASGILMLFMPLLPVLAIGVKLSSPGPVIFRQRRTGLHGEEIVIWKFRSMRTMEDGAVVRQAQRHDSRVTPFGAFLRRTSLDELPQLVNVLQGRMSLVGPRPQAVTHTERYRELVHAYMIRHKVKPGITGWAQIRGHRGEVDTLEKLQARLACDLEYLSNWSLALDLRIVARTIGLMFFDRNAY